MGKSFSKNWKKANEEEKASSRAESADLRLQLEAMVTQRVNEETTSDFQKLRVKMKAILDAAE